MFISFATSYLLLASASLSAGPILKSVKSEMIGSASLQIMTNLDGTVKDVTIISATSAEQAAMAAKIARDWKFQAGQYRTVKEVKLNFYP